MIDVACSSTNGETVSIAVDGVSLSDVGRAVKVIAKEVRSACRSPTSVEVVEVPDEEDATCSMDVVTRSVLSAARALFSEFRLNVQASWVCPFLDYGGDEPIRYGVVQMAVADPGFARFFVGFGPDYFSRFTSEEVNLDILVSQTVAVTRIGEATAVATMLAASSTESTFEGRVEYVWPGLELVGRAEHVEKHVPDVPGAFLGVSELVHDASRYKYIVPVVAVESSNLAEFVEKSKQEVRRQVFEAVDRFVDALHRKILGMSVLAEGAGGRLYTLGCASELFSGMLPVLAVRVSRNGVVTLSLPDFIAFSTIWHIEWNVEDTEGRAKCRTTIDAFAETSFAARNLAIRMNIPALVTRGNEIIGAEATFSLGRREEPQKEKTWAIRCNGSSTDEVAEACGDVFGLLLRGLVSGWGMGVLE